MTVRFAGNDLDAFPNAFSCVETTGGNYDSTYVQMCVQIQSTGGGYLPTPSIPMTAGFLHFEKGTGNNNAGSQAVTLFNTDGNAVIRLQRVNDPIYQLQWSSDNGATWTNIGGTGTPSGSPNSSGRFDIQWNINGASSVLGWYVNGTTIVEATGDFSAIGEVDHAILYFTGNNTYVSQIIIADEATINYRYSEVVPTANGSEQNWDTPDYTNVNKKTISDASFTSTPTADEITLYKSAARSFATTAYAVESLFVTGRARSDTGGPPDVAGVVKIGGTDYVTDGVTLSVGYGGFITKFDANPATGVAWTAADAGSADLEYGMKALAA